MSPSRVLAGMTMSLDGFVNDPSGDLMPLYPQLEKLRETEMLQESMQRTGAVIMGRHAYDLAQGDFTGYEYQCPIFVLTHRPPSAPAKGQNDRLRIHFVGGPVHEAVRQAKDAAGGKDVTAVGGPDVLRQLLDADLVDELHIGIAPIFLGGGLRMFEDVGVPEAKWGRPRVIESPGRVDLAYPRLRGTET